MSRSYPAIEVKARYDAKNDHITVCFTFIDAFLKSIPEQNLDSSGQYLKPRGEVINEIKQTFEKNMRLKEVRSIAEKLNEKETNNKIKKFDVVVGMAYLDDKGKKSHIGHYENYKPYGPSSSEPARIMKDRN